MYGESAITPNMHLHGHLRDVLKDYGPVQEFWLFPYERYNGILGHQPTNNKLIEPQLVKRFLQDSLAYSFSFPSEFEQDFTSPCQFHDQRICGSTLCTISPTPDELYHLSTQSTRGTLCAGDQTLILLLYQRLYQTTYHVSVNSIFQKYSSIEIRGKRYNTNRQSIALVKWDNDLFLDQATISEETLHHNSHCRPVKVHYFAKVSFFIGDHTSNRDSQGIILLAVVSWYFPHTCRHVLGKPVEVWSPSMFEAHGVYSFVPIHVFVARCAYCVKVVESESLLLVVPLVE